MKIVIGNLLTQTEVPDIAHGANCFHTMGAGVAKGVSLLYPDAYKVDKETNFGGFSKLGSFSQAITKDKVVFNVYSQYKTGANIEYGALYNGLLDVAYSVNAVGKRKFAIPYLMGCGIAGGDWNIVQRIIEQVETIITENNIAADLKNPDFTIICYDIDGLSLLVPKEEVYELPLTEPIV